MREKVDMATAKSARRASSARGFVLIVASLSSVLENRVGSTTEYDFIIRPMSNMNMTSLYDL